MKGVLAPKSWILCQGIRFLADWEASKTFASAQWHQDACEPISFDEISIQLEVKHLLVQRNYDAKQVVAKPSGYEFGSVDFADGADCDGTCGGS